MKLSTTHIRKLISYARTFINTPYTYGAPSTHIQSFDCSSFIQHIFKHVGITLPRSSILQAADPQGVLIFPSKTKKITYKTGDVLFMRSDRGYYYDELFATKPLAIGHVALYIGNGEIIHAKKSLGGVVIQKLKELQKDAHYKTIAIRRHTISRPIYRVSAHSQYTSITNPAWKDHACGIVSLGMVLAFYKKRFKNYDYLLERGLRMHIRKEGVGWIHAGLARLAQTHGVYATSYDWYKDSADDAFAKMVSFLEYGPLIASIHKDFNQKNGGHLIVVTGYKDGHIYYNEPAAHRRQDLKQKTTKDAFIHGWKRRIIWIHPQSIS